MSLVVIVPSRGRPHAVPDLAAAFTGTVQADGTRLVLAVDLSDPDHYRYREAVAEVRDDRVTVDAVVGGRMAAALNETAVIVAAGEAVEAIGFMGDDHRPRTVGWDAAYLAALRDMGAGIVYGDDGLQHEALPTQCAMSSSIVRTLGWMCPPVLQHLWIDNFWRDLGEAAGCLRYLPDIVVEHMHPYVGKAEMDEGYVRVNALEMIDADRGAYEVYAAEHLAAAAEKVRALRG